MSLARVLTQQVTSMATSDVSWNECNDYVECSNDARLCDLSYMQLEVLHGCV